MKEISGYKPHIQEGTLLNANESYEGLDAETLQELIQVLPTLPLHRYPQDDPQELYEAYQSVIGVQPTHMMAGNGSDALLGLMIGSFLSKGKVLYTLAPDFSMYDYYASNYEAVMEKYVTEEDGSVDVSSFIRQGKERGVDLIVFSNPNNPTGHCLKREEVLDIVSAFSEIPVIIDEAYMEFGNQSVVHDLDRYSNLYVTRTLSKAYAMAGLRIGFVLSQPSNIQRLKDARVPYTVNRLSQAAATIALRHADQFGMRIQQTIFFRDEMFNKLSMLRGITMYESHANFLYGKAENKELLMRLFAQEKIWIRDFEGTDRFRITIGNKEENEKVMQVMMKYAKEALK